MKQLVLLLSFVVLSACSDKPTQTWAYTEQGAFSGAINSEGTRALVGSIHHGGSLWNTRKNARLFNWNHRENEFSQILSADFSPDDQYALTADNKTLVLWQTKTGEALGFWRAPGNIYELKLINQGEYALLGMDDFTAVLFNAKYGGVVQTYQHAGPVLTVDISNDGQYAITGSQDLSARVWNAKTGRELYRFEHNNQVNKVAISPDGSLAMSTSYREKMKIWQLSDGSELAEIGNANYSYTAARFVANNTQLMVGTTARTVILYDIESGDELKRWKMPIGEFQMYASSEVLDVQLVGKNAFALLSDGQFSLLRVVD